MTVEYYVKKRLKNGESKVVETCTTPEQAQRQMKLYSDQNPGNFYVVYSEDAILEYQQRTRKQTIVKLRAKRVLS